MSPEDTANIVSYVLTISILIGVVILDLVRNPLHHPRKFINFRTCNWLIVGLTYACCYMARYGVSAGNVQAIYDEYNITKQDYANILLIGNLTYAISVFINGFLVDIIGAKYSMVISAIGAGSASFLSGLIQKLGNLKGNSMVINTSIWFFINNYFQTFSTSAIVKFSSRWYHDLERGTFSGIFGVVISFGFELAFTVDSSFIQSGHPENYWLMFLVPGCLLLVMSILNFLFVQATPEDKFAPEEIVTLRSIDKQYPKSKEENKEKFTCTSFWNKIWNILHPVLLIKMIYPLLIIAIFLGYIRDGSINYYSQYFQLQDNYEVPYVISETGLTVGGMIGSLVMGWISDVVFNGSRQPVLILNFALMTIIYSCFAISIQYDNSSYSQAFEFTLAAFCFQSANGLICSALACEIAPKQAGFVAGLLDAIQKIGSSLSSPIITAITESTWIWWPLKLVLIISIMNVKPHQKKEEPEKEALLQKEEK